MDKNDLVKKLKKEIQNIYSLSDRFEDVSQIRKIDIDLALSKVRNLYDLLLQLNSQAKNEKLTEEKSLVEHKIGKFEKDSKSQAKEEAVNSELNVNKEEEIEIKEPEFIIETPKKEKKTTENKDTSSHLILEENMESNGNDSPEIVAEKFHTKRFVHDNISNKNSKKDVSAKLQSKPIKDINTGIGLNDKFIFIRELFKGDKNHYLETIQILNNFDTFDNALDFLNSNFDWDAEDPNYERLKELVRRKYS